MSEVSWSARCTHCWEQLSPTHEGPCPMCGRSGKTVDIGHVDEFEIATSLSWRKQRESFQRKPWLMAFVWATTIASPFVGLLFGGLLGVAIGAGVGVGLLVLGRSAEVTIREIERGRD
jgi:hypothetical protein